MKRLLVLALSLLLLFGAVAPGVLARKQLVIKEVGVEEAPESGEVATSAAALEIEAVAKEDITERESPVAGKLEGYLVEADPGALSWSNFLQHAIRGAVAQGVSPNTIVLVLLFPLVAAMIAGGRHLLGLTGFGIFVPAILAVAFLATGIRVGLTLFVIIWFLASLSRSITQGLKLQYLPRMALLMWLISVGVLSVLLGAVNINLGELSAVSIFPILILMLLAENFIEVQMGKSKREAFRVTIQTLVMAVAAALVMGLDGVQKWVLLNPELFLVIVAGFNIYIGKYVGLRALEYVKFKDLTRKK